MSSFCPLPGARYPLDAVKRRRPAVDRMEYVLPAIVAVVVGPLSAWITVQLSLRRFRAQKWWEMRVEAYRRVIEALHQAKTFSSTYLDADIWGQRLSDDKKRELSALVRKADREIDRASDAAGFLISHAARERLREYQLSIDEDNIPSWWEYIDKHWGETDSCLKDIIEIARQDLELERRGWWPFSQPSGVG